MTTHDPYNTDALKALMQHAYRLGWYSGLANLFTIRMEGGFEAFSGQATETWEQRFVVTTDKIICNDGTIHPAISVTGHTLEEACSKALRALKGDLGDDSQIPT